MDRRPNRIFAGWAVVAAVFVLLSANAGFGFYGLAVYLNAITTEQGLSVGSVSLATAIFFLVSGVVGRLIAPLIDRYDIRITVAIGGLIAAIGMWLVGVAQGLAAIYAAYVVFAIGCGMCGLVPATALVTRWFSARRSVALSVASTGLSVGGLTFTVWAAYLIDRRGMGDAAGWLAIVFLATVAVALVALWPEPAARGTWPDGIAPGRGEGPEAALAEQAPTTEEYRQAIATGFFRLVTAAFVVTMAAQVGGIAQIAKMGSERVDAATGTLLVSTVAASSVIARLIGGVVAARVNLVRLTASLALVQGLALFLISGLESRLGLVAATMIFGATIGNLLMLQPLVLADRFGVALYPRVFALSQMVVVGVGVAGGPYLLGFLRDQASYRTSYVVAAGLSAIGAAVFAAAHVRSLDLDR